VRQIRDLKKVFNRFGFSKSTEVKLHTKNDETPQHTLNAAIMSHIQHNDGPNKLMIIYYTGHGILDKDGDLKLAS
jgi:alanine racemase